MVVAAPDIVNLWMRGIEDDGVNSMNAEGPRVGDVGECDQVSVVYVEETNPKSTSCWDTVEPPNDDPDDRIGRIPRTGDGSDI